MKVSSAQYAKALLELTSGKSQGEVLDVVKNFAAQLKKDGQLKNAAKIMEKFSEIFNAANGIVKAQIVIRQKSESFNVQEIEKFIKEKYLAKEVEMEIVVDEKIQGGIIIRVGDEVIDGSILNQLRRLKKALI